MNTSVEMNRFLSGVEKRAFQIARMAVQDNEDALDIVQDSMFTLAQKYANKPVDEWRPLFFRILKNRITDQYRRRSVKSKWFPKLFSLDEAEDYVDPVEQATARADSAPDVRLALDVATEHLVEAVQALPTRQQQVFLFRAYEGMSVAETSVAMECSEGSVKTHYYRALEKLRQKLEDYR